MEEAGVKEKKINKVFKKTRGIRIPKEIIKVIQIAIKEVTTTKGIKEIKIIEVEVIKTISSQIRAHKDTKTISSKDNTRINLKVINNRRLRITKHKFIRIKGIKGKVDLEGTIKAIKIKIKAKYSIKMNTTIGLIISVEGVVGAGRITTGEVDVKDLRMHRIN